MTKYYGPIKTKAQAQAISIKLRKVGTSDAVGAASLLENNWHSVASRPELAARILALSWTEPLDINRVGSILNGILKRRVTQEEER